MPKRRGQRRGGRKPKGPLTRDLAGARRVARQRFGIERLHPEQERAIEAVLAGRDVLAVLPTGFGKSLIYQTTAQLADRPTVVVSPLIALMADQEEALAKRQLPVVRIDGTLTAAQRRAALERVDAGGALVVLTTPESLENEELHARLKAAEPWLLAIDEAHCISEWGHDFRPAYLRLATARRTLGDPVLLTLTATATPRVREDVAARTGLRDYEEVVAPPYRENLRLGVDQVTGLDKPARAGQLLLRMPRPGIVYCATTVEVDRIHGALHKGRLPVERYHGRMRQEEREVAQERFMRAGGRRIMVATSAFGMGIDKPDIRFVLHYQAPGSLEQYVQEAGRAGRDGETSLCILLYDPDDLRIQRHLQSRSRASADQLSRVVRALRAWVGEERPVSTAELALSAGVPQAVCGTACARLEEMGALEREARRWRAAVPLTELAKRSKDLGKRLETQRLEDVERLAELDAYARTDECRSVQLRRYFGEPDPPECGTCDVCSGTLIKVSGKPPRRGGPDRGRRRGKKKPTQRGQAKKKRKKKRGKKVRHGADTGLAQSASGAGQGRKRRRRRRRRRGGAKPPAE